MVEEINGVKCSTTVKYLGVRVAVDKKEQLKISKEQIHKNTSLLRWRLKNVEPDVLQQLTCCLARSLLIYIGTPMADAGLWKRQEIDRFEAGIYRKILGAANNITNKAILNTMTQIRLAGDASPICRRILGSSSESKIELLTTSTEKTKEPTMNR